MKNLFKTVILLIGSLNAIMAQVSFVSSGQKINPLAGRGVILADINSDGFLDAFVVNEDGPDGKGYNLFFGDGSGQFKDSTHLTNPISWADNPVVGDINGDGRLEVITGWTVWLNDGSGKLTADTTRFIASHDVILNHYGLADLNGDSQLDLFATVYNSRINEERVYLNNGNGHLVDTGQRLGQGQSNHYPIELGDLNGDGYIDAVTTGWRNNSGDPCPNRILFNNGKGNFTETGQILDEGMRDSHGLALGDIDKDGDLDIIIGMQSSPFARIYINNGQGHFTAGQTLGSKFVEKVEVADLDGDGYLDIFFACNGSNEIWINDGRGNFSDSGQRLGSEWSWNAELGDLNSDGKLDIFAVNFGAEFSNGNFVPRGRLAEVWLNSTPATFSYDYYGQTPPGNIPIVFAPGTVSVDNKNSHALVVSPDGRMIIFSRYPDGTSYILSKKNSNWTGPVESFFHGKEVSFTPDGNRIFYYTSDDIFYVEKNSTGWNQPVKLGPQVNTSGLTDYYPCIVSNGSLYFSRDGNWATGRLMFSKFQNGEFQNATDLGLPINSGGALHAWVSPDESYILFNSPRTGSHTNLDIWVSFRKSDSTWSDPKNLGGQINSGADAILCPVVSPDSKYLFFTKLNYNSNTGNIYWVSTSIIDSLRNSVTNTWVPKEGSQLIPENPDLKQNYPNPFNPSTIIKYSLAKATNVKLSIYNLLGQQIRTLENAFQNAGDYSLTWNATNEANTPVVTGVYFCRLNLGTTTLQKKMLLVR